MKNIHVLIKLGFLCLGCLAYLPLRAQLSSGSDSTEVFQSAQEIIVRGKRPEKFSPGSRITSIDTLALGWYKNGSLADMLQFYLPVYLKSYGPGMLSSMAFRGTSASHTAVLWNGFNIIQPSNGQTDFALIPVFSPGTIDIQHGNASTNYGSGAIGGTVLLSSPLHFRKGFSGSTQQSIGSFGLNTTHIRANYSNAKLSWQTKLFHGQVQNDFTFQNSTKPGAPTERQVNGALRQYGFTQDIGIWLNQKNLLTLRAWYNFSRRHIPPAMGAAHRNARQKDENIRLAGEWIRFTKLGSTTARIAYFDEKLVYQEEQLLSRTNIQTLQSQAEHEYAYKDKLIVKAGAELQGFYARVDGYGTPQTETRASAFLLTRIDAHPKLKFNINLRQAIVDGYNPPFTPSAGYEYKLLHGRVHALSLKGNIARSYRVPTLNERFWQQGGNPEIKPEDSWSAEKGLVHRWHHTKFELLSELTGYYMKVNNWIQWLPGRQGFWSPVNVMQVNPRGIEISSTLKLHANQTAASLGTSYAYTASTISKSYQVSSQTPGKQLMYVPLHTGAMHGSVVYKGFTLGTNIAYTGFRYTSNSNSDWLRAYLLLNAFAARSFTWRAVTLQVSGRVNNLTNTSYQNMENRPMPGRQAELSIQVSFHK